MTSQQALYIINGLFTVIMIIGWYWVRGVVANQKEADNKIALLTTELAVNTADDKNHQAQFKEIKEWMVRIDDRLDKLKGK